MSFGLPFSIEPEYVSNAAKFSKRLEAFAKNLDIQTYKLIKRVAFQVFRGVVEKTPVDTGVARASWVVGVGKKHPPYIAAAGATARFPIFDLRYFKGRAVKIVISNYVPYIYELENGSSKQAPYGMAQITINEVMAELNSIGGADDDYEKNG